MIHERQDIRLLRALKSGDRAAFDGIYDVMAAPLLHYISQRIQDRESSEELVQEIFLSLWSRREEIDIRTDIRAYLFGAAKFQVLNYIRSEKVHRKYMEHLALFALQSGQSDQVFADHSLRAKDLTVLVERYLRQLPAKCQQAFRLSRFEQKTIPEIALEMNISTRTVENYLTRALKHLRDALSKYTWLLMILNLLD